MPTATDLRADGDGPASREHRVRRELDRVVLGADGATRLEAPEDDHLVPDRQTAHGARGAGTRAHHDDGTVMRAADVAGSDEEARGLPALRRADAPRSPSDHPVQRDARPAPAVALPPPALVDHRAAPSRDLLTA
ncbi:hypothetical protein [Clavibacter michiganensis]|uniref:hypothetical protein n=1 Tax=Clavibacter michiganensis TaxID=28447 RepID=UPI00292FECED|nr:hypothetical protein [Clavibacter michiganensis]